MGKKAQGIMADGQADDDEDEGVPEEKRLADDVRSDAKVREMEMEMEIKILKVAVKKNNFLGQEVSSEHYLM